MLKITKKTIKKALTQEDFLKLKKDLPFEEYRQMSKGINFGFLFGRVAISFSNNSLELIWSEEKADQYIKENKLEELKREIIKKYPNDTPKQWKFITCASDIRTKFFKAYPGLMERIIRERNFANQNGYVRSWHGAVRRTSELFFMEKDDNGNLKYSNDDNKLYRKQISTLQNIAANTTIQNFEAVLVMSAIVEIQKWLEDNNMKSKVWNSVHDSIDLYIYKEEKDVVLQKVNDICTRDVPELLGMPMKVEFVVADMQKDEHYKGGKEWHPK